MTPIKTSLLRGMNEPPTELPGALYGIKAIVPFSPARHTAVGRNDPNATVDDWRWVSVTHSPPTVLLEIGDVPAELVKFKARFEDDPAYGEPHFRLIEVTGEGFATIPVIGLSFGKDGAPENDGTFAEIELSSHFEGKTS